MDDYISLADRLRRGEYTNDVDGTLWRSAFRYLVDRENRIYFDKPKFHTLWTANGGQLRGKIKDDALVLAMLKLALPGYVGGGLDLYRGECTFLFESQQIGFCWSPDVVVATQFARGLNAIESGGVLLKAFAPEAAILAGPNAHSRDQMGEHEYTCDPGLLVGIDVLMSYPRLGGSA